MITKMMQSAQPERLYPYVKARITQNFLTTWHTIA